MNATSSSQDESRLLAGKPVIFLDIDGVLNRKSRQRPRHVDADLLARFERLVRATGAWVVLASTWRHDPAALADARRFNIPFDDVLPDLRPQSRGTEIEAWLATHPQAGSFVVIDDEDDGYGKFPLFQPQPSQGLSSRVANAVEAYLKGERSRDMRRNLFDRFCQILWFACFGHKG